MTEKGHTEAWHAENHSLVQDVLRIERLDWQPGEGAYEASQRGVCMIHGEGYIGLAPPRWEYSNTEQLQDTPTGCRLPPLTDVRVPTAPWTINQPWQQCMLYVLTIVPPCMASLLIYGQSNKGFLDVTTVLHWSVFGMFPAHG